MLRAKQKALKQSGAAFAQHRNKKGAPAHPRGSMCALSAKLCRQIPIWSCRLKSCTQNEAAFLVSDWQPQLLA